MKKSIKIAILVLVSMFMLTNLRHLEVLNPVFARTSEEPAELKQNNPIKIQKNRNGLAYGEVRTTKTATPVDGMVNQWDINLKIEARNHFPPPASDVVLIMDISGSMLDNNRIAKAKNAAIRFANQILKEGYLNRIALVTFSSDVTNYDFFGPEEKQTLIDQINALEPKGGTFTQAGIHEATKVMQNSSAKKRSFVLISDGVATYSYPPIEPYTTVSGTQEFMPPEEYEWLMEPNDRFYETTKIIPKEYFNYNVKKPYGNGIRYLFAGKPPQFPIPANKNDKIVANHSNSAIAEASIAKTEKATDGTLLVNSFYTVGVDLGLQNFDCEKIISRQSMLEIASSEDYSYDADAEELEGIMEEIGGSMVGSVSQGIINSPMGTGFELEGQIETSNATQGAVTVNNVNGISTILWLTGALNKPITANENEDIMYAELKYRVNAMNPVLQVLDGDGLAKTNGETVFNYQNYEGETWRQVLVVPKVKPTIISLKKTLLDASGVEIIDAAKKEQFSAIYGQDSYTKKDEFSLYADNSQIKTVHPWQANQDYFVEEKLTTNQNYKVKIKWNEQETEGTKGVFRFNLVAGVYLDQELEIINQKKKNLVRLNIRQSVLQANEELVVPSKGFFTSKFDVTKAKINLISGSTTKDTSNEVKQDLFSTYSFKLEDNQQRLIIADLIPEYYQLYGHITTSTANDLGNKHISANQSELVREAPIELDYQQNEEYWVTIFIQPKLGRGDPGTDEESPRFYSWDYKMNQFKP